MSRYARQSSVILAVLLIASFLFMFPTESLEAATKLAGEDALSADELREAYAEAAAGGEKVKILVVPGHEPTYGGAHYAGYYERELVVPLAEKIATELRADPNLEVMVSRGLYEWNPTFERYFDRSERSVPRFVEEHKERFAKLLKRGRVAEHEEQAGHNRAPDDVAYRLYGITKWANTSGVDLMIHVHLNDAGGRAADAPGPYTGLAIYVPYKEYGNSEASVAVAEDVFDRLTTLAAKSTLPIEDKGIVEDATLIAIGAHNTSAVASVLVEYGYLYEPKFVDGNVRDIVFSDYAYQTARGVADFFGREAGGRYATRVLPYTWTDDVVASAGGLPYASFTPGVPAFATSSPASVPLYALQQALREEGVYPVAPSTLINCPIDGRMSTCVTEAVAAYQEKKGLTKTGTLDAPTRNALNASYSAVPYVAEPIPAPTLAAGSCIPLTGSLEPESTGDAVTRLQTILAQDPQVYPSGLVTGYYGAQTDRAVKAFQEKHGIAKAGGPGYGVVGPKTRAALNEACK